MTTTHAARAQKHLADALDAALDEFPSKAAQKRVLDTLNRAYDAARDAYGDLYRVELFANDERFGGRDAWPAGEFLDAREVPFDLHHVRDHHVARIAEYSAELAEVVEAARTARADVKATPVAAKVLKTDEETEARKIAISRTIREEMERLGRMYHEALDLGRAFGGLPVSANVHLVTNQHGTTFVRAFYYLAGKRTPLNVILAAADTLAREKA
jgi:hypothetical protein